jgi:hypothetical protein
MPIQQEKPGTSACRDRWAQIVRARNAREEEYPSVRPNDGQPTKQAKVAIVEGDDRDAQTQR